MQFLEKHKNDWQPWGTDPPHGTRNVDLVFWTGDDFPPDERDKDNDNKVCHSRFCCSAPSELS